MPDFFLQRILPAYSIIDCNSIPVCWGGSLQDFEKDSKVETSNRRPEVEQYFDWFNFAFSSTTTIGMASFKVVFPSVDNYFILIYLL